MVGETVGDLMAQGRIEAIQAAVPANSANMLPAIYDVAKSAFVMSLHEIFAIGVIACLLGATVALLMRNPAPRHVTADNRLQGAIPHPAVAD